MKNSFQPKVPNQILKIFFIREKKLPKSPPVQAEARPPEQENAPYIKTPYTMPAAPAFNEKPNSTLL